MISSPKNEFNKFIEYGSLVGYSEFQLIRKEEKMKSICENCLKITETNRGKCHECKESKQEYRYYLEMVREMLLENLENDTFEWTKKYGDIRLNVSIDCLKKAKILIK